MKCLWQVLHHADDFLSESIDIPWKTCTDVIVRVVLDDEAVTGAISQSTVPTVAA